MTTEEALETCHRWLRHLEKQRQKSVDMQRAASLARQGKHKEARRIKARIDRAPKVFDGATLEPAVRHLMQIVEER